MIRKYAASSRGEANDLGLPKIGTKIAQVGNSRLGVGYNAADLVPRARDAVRFTGFPGSPHAAKFTQAA